MKSNKLAHSTQRFVVLNVYVLMHALPGIVEGARKTSQGGSCIRVGAPLSIFEAITNREQYTSAVSTVSCIML